MQTFFRLLAQLKTWLSKRFSRSYRTCTVEGALPAPLQRRTVYIVQEDGYLEHVSMVCPCSCREILHMNLIPDERPCWSVTNHSDGTISLHPSVWRKRGCQSHFWVRHGRIFWC